MAILGTLTTASLRDAWPNEAHHFTPWLAEHLDQLSAEIGIPLELEGMEVLVGNFSADILARNPLDDTLVLIENQLERTDHTHLGQIMTYLAGLGAHTIIWVASDFREPHLSALKWLNEHTVNPYAFFAVKVRVVRIGDSPLAPIFEVVERPNQWDRHVQEITQPSLSKSAEWRKDFWLHFIERFPDEARFGPASALHNRWYTQESVDLAISIYVSKKSVGIYIRGRFGADPDSVADTLAPYRELLAEATGSSTWSGRTPGHFFPQQSDLGIPTDPVNWDALADWLHAAKAKYEQALRACFGVQQ